MIYEVIVTKQADTDLRGIYEYIAFDDKEKLHVFDENGLYLATKKIVKNNPKAEQIQTDNKYHMRWNREVDRAIVSGVICQQQQIQQIKDRGAR